MFFPDVTLPHGEYKLRMTNHAHNACANDRYGAFELPPSIHIPSHSIFEMELQKNEIKKIVARVPYDDDCDVSLALIPERNTMVVKTAWLNMKTDSHTTLKRHLYQTV